MTKPTPPLNGTEPTPDERSAIMDRLAEQAVAAHTEVPKPPTDCGGSWQMCSVPPHRPDMLVRMLADGWEPFHVTAVTTREQVGGPLAAGRQNVQLVTRPTYHLRRVAPEGTPPQQLLLHID